jgi:glycosyltransferase involved in cell wall biosynthesis
MRIAQVAPLYESIPPRLYGGTERIVAYLADALVELGHDVTVFTSADAVTKARLLSTRDQALRLDPAPLKSDLAAHLCMVHELRRHLDEFDVLHFHTDMVHFPFFEAIATRTLTTLHGRLDIKDLSECYQRWPHYPLVSISDSQRAPMPSANWLDTVPHGLPENLYRPVAKPSCDYLAFLGRMSPEKRPDRAIAIARRVNMAIRMAAKVDAADAAYFRATVEPLLSQPGVSYLGEIDDAKKQAFLAHASALLFPIDWPEPFGMVMIEAMACGTPVIAWNCGAVREVIDHGITGFIVDTEDEAVDAIMRLPELDRAHIRQVFLKRFSARIMAERYLALYRQLNIRGIETKPAHLASPRPAMKGMS